MDKDQINVREFHEKASQTINVSPSTPSEKDRVLRVKLLLEEVFELADASGVEVCIVDYNYGEVPLHISELIIKENKKEVDIVGVADALADIDYVNNGAAVVYGIDLEPCKKEVHRSNMSKFIDGYRRDDGKWIKGPSYSPANLKSILDKQ